MEKKNLEQKQLEDKLTIACEVTENRLAVLWGAIDSIDTKINIALGFASSILGLLAGFYAIGDRVWPFPSLVLFGLAAVAYILLAILSILAYRAKAWSYRPDVKTLLENCENENYDIVQIKRWVAEECNTSCYKNLENLNKKAALANYVLVILVVETIMLTSGLAYAMFTD
ncbi:MAG: hypothetical protein KAV68_04085 [Dehalococcoidales bacterium]|nr:hypothetical protein [Dehalococcoidales bacterium]